MSSRVPEGLLGSGNKELAVHTAYDILQCLCHKTNQQELQIYTVSQHNKQQVKKETGTHIFQYHQIIVSKRMFCLRVEANMV